jgi:hypothetical protein
MTIIGGPRASFTGHKFSMKQIVNSRHKANDAMMISEICGEHAELTDCV